jgi:hypothetical protein
MRGGVGAAEVADGIRVADLRVAAEIPSTAAGEERILPGPTTMEIWLSREPEILVLELLRNIRADVARVSDKVETPRVDLHSEVQSLRADVSSDFVAARKELGEQIAGLRRAVVEYHPAVLGQGVLISELEARPAHRAPSRPPGVR